RSVRKVRHANGKRRRPNGPRKSGAARRRRDGVFRTLPFTIAAIIVAMALVAVVTGISASGEPLTALIVATGTAALALVLTGIVRDTSRRRLKASRDASRAKATTLKTKMRQRAKSL